MHSLLIVIVATLLAGLMPRNFDSRLIDQGTTWSFQF